MLHDAWLFAECSEAERARIAASSTMRAVPGGNVVVREGAQGDTCFVVLDGHALVSRGERLLGDDGPPAVVGVLALAGLPHHATVTAVTDMKLLAFSRRTYERMRAEGGARSIAHRLDVVVAEQRRLAQCAPVAVRVLSSVL